jgi:hypothetical protein
MSYLRRARARLLRLSGEALGWVGVALIAYGLSHIPGWWGAVLPPLIIGAALLAAARSE